MGGEFSTAELQRAHLEADLDVLGLKRPSAIAEFFGISVDEAASLLAGQLTGISPSLIHALEQEANEKQQWDAGCALYTLAALEGDDRP